MCRENVYIESAIIQMQLTRTNAQPVKATTNIIQHSEITSFPLCQFPTSHQLQS